ncbi:MAG: tetratricopeptide repeat protein [candidate division Zixibacteria bacterium]|nr:tetratricopeptide repeat protein [candidate division Zixibacteria bacterium]
MGYGKISKFLRHHWGLLLLLLTLAVLFIVDRDWNYANVANWIAANGLVSLYALAALAAILGFIHAVLKGRPGYRQKSEQQSLIESLLRPCKLKDFRADTIIHAYREPALNTYLPISADSEIDEAIKQRVPVIFTGRSGIGKTHTAIQHLLPYHDWVLLRPTREALAGFSSLQIEQRPHVLLLDDLQFFLDQATDALDVRDFVEHFKRRATDLIVVATVDDTHPSLASSILCNKPFTDWKKIPLNNWTDEQGQRLSRITGGNFANWDGTPLSLKEPPQVMKGRYADATQEQKAVLRALKRLSELGINTCPQRVLREFFCSSVFSGQPQDFNSALEQITKVGFLRESSAQIAAWERYLDFVEDYTDENDAYEVLISILDKNSEITSLLALGRKRLNDGDLLEAERICRRCVEIAPEHEGVRYTLGVVCIKARKWLEAAFNFWQAARIKPEWSTAWYRFNYVAEHLLKPTFEQQGEFEVLSASYSDPSFSAILKFFLLRREDKKDEALTQLETVLRTVPNFRVGWYWRGRLLSDLGRFQDAVGAFRSSIEIEPTVGAYCGMSGALRKVGNLDGAMAAFREAIHLDPDLVKDHYHYARLLFDLGRFQDAIGAFRRSIEIEPTAGAYCGMAGALREVGNLDGAMDAFREAIHLDPNLVEAHYHFARVLEELGFVTEAEAEMETAISLRPDEAQFHSLLGGIIYRQKKYKISEKHYRRAIELKPDYPEALVGLAGALRYQGMQRVDEAVEANNKALEFDPHSASAHLGLGFCYKMKRRFDLAREHFEKATRLDPNMAEAHFQLCISLRNEERYPEAKAAIERARVLGYPPDKIKLEFEKLRPFLSDSV